MLDSDEALFERLALGDMRAFDRLYDRFERPLYGFIRAELRDAIEAEDVLHEAFLAVLREREKAGRPRSFRGWIFGVAHHLCLNRLRSRKRERRALGPVPEPAHADSSDELDARRRSRLLELAVGRLPVGLGEVYRLRAAGLSYDEMADALGLPVGTVKSRMHEMVRRLREEVLP